MPDNPLRNTLIHRHIERCSQIPDMDYFSKFCCVAYGLFLTLSLCYIPYFLREEETEPDNTCRSCGVNEMLGETGLCKECVK